MVLPSSPILWGPKCPQDTPGTAPGHPLAPWGRCAGTIPCWVPLPGLSQELKKQPAPCSSRHPPHGPHPVPIPRIPRQPHPSYWDALGPLAAPRRRRAPSRTERKEERDAALQVSTFFGLGFFFFFFFFYPALRGFWQVSSVAMPARRAACQLRACHWLPSGLSYPGWSHSSVKCIFSPLFPFPPAPLAGAPFDLVLVKSCRTWPQAAVQVKSSGAEHKLLGINPPGEMGPEHPHHGKRAPWMGAGAPASSHPERG